MILAAVSSCSAYYFGVGIYDITGPAADVNMMGYAKLSQNAAGIHLRLFSRAFIIHENRGTRPVLFINLDLGMASELLKIELPDDLTNSKNLQSVRMAWENRIDGRIFIAKGILTDASINRSPESYEMNPAEERVKCVRTYNFAFRFWIGSAVLALF
ncbi:putative Neutral ceramidase C [Fasciolopsis buskii]|uniref:Neutral ceramidase n=1 Tax=Fasciolopsis buskii TaxID=27845 RepID=A0A8E0RQ19_9TREM|nr:putative Neutral ceramidase C [Fasciolopsis buski]